MTRAQRALAIAARAKLRRLTSHCDEACPGWAVFGDGSRFQVQRCDACWRDASAPLTDEEAASLLEAQLLLEQTIAEEGHSLFIAQGATA